MIDRNEIAQIIVRWCIANGEEFLPNPLADMIMVRIGAELSTIRSRLSDYEEKEAACCPEDVGFNEYIKHLKSQLSSKEKEIEAMRCCGNCKYDNDNSEEAVVIICRSCREYRNWKPKER